ncbi:MAG: hypothetical protein K0B16_03345 [Burkholderiaceae bacterium]|nr:hypothetical protein [Burkholderiaceae bacterium]
MWNGRKEICRVCHVPHDHGQAAQPDGTAKLCLGCHDGTVGIDTFDRYAGGSCFMDDDYNPLFKVPGFTRANLELETCHDVHDQDPVAGTRLLRTAQTVAQGGVASGICLPCHVK